MSSAYEEYDFSLIPGVVIICIVLLVGLLHVVGWSIQDVASRHTKNLELEKLDKIKNSKSVAEFANAILFNDSFKSYDDTMSSYISSDLNVTNRGDKVRADLQVTKSSKLTISINSADYDQSFVDCVLALSSACQVFVLVNIHDRNRTQQIKDEFLTSAQAIVKGETVLVPPHRIIFCSSPTGRVAAARQLEPDVVIEHDVEVVERLATHVRTSILVGEKSTTTRPCPAGVIAVDSYKELLRVKL